MPRCFSSGLGDGVACPVLPKSLQDEEDSQRGGTSCHSLVQAEKVMYWKGEA